MKKGKKELKEGFRTKKEWTAPEIIQLVPEKTGRR